MTAPEASQYPLDPTVHLPINTLLSEMAAFILIDQRLPTSETWITWQDTGTVVRLPSGLKVVADWNETAHLGRLLAAGTAPDVVLPLWAVAHDLPAYEDPRR